MGVYTAQFSSQIFQYGIMGLETTDHTDGRVHFHGLIETVSVVPGCVWRPPGQNPDFGSGGGTITQQYNNEANMNISVRVL